MEKLKQTCSECGNEFEIARAVHIEARHGAQKIKADPMCLRCATKFVEKHGNKYQVIKSTDLRFSIA